MFVDFVVAMGETFSMTYDTNLANVVEFFVNAEATQIIQ